MMDGVSKGRAGNDSQLSIRRTVQMKAKRKMTNGNGRKRKTSEEAD
jgi:uncharacterized sporulation protein YeaH/YhbH (DUF444 family)